MPKSKNNLGLAQHQFLKKFKSDAGFTIIELMVSASIIAIMSGLIIANFRGSTQKSSLGNESERLSSILREANIDALIGLTVSGQRPVGGFGLHLVECSSSCRYLLFADNGDYVYDANDDEIIQDVGMLENNVYVDSLLPETVVDIVFTPPQGTIMINGGTAVDQVDIVLGFMDTGYSKTLTVSRISGQISIE